MVLRVDKEREAIKFLTSAPIQKPEQKTALVVSSYESKVSPVQASVSTNPAHLKERPKTKPDNLLASADKNLIIPAKPAENIEKPVENVSIISEKEEKPA